MAGQNVAIRALNRSSQIRVVNSAGTKVKLSTTADTVVNLDDAANRRALNAHQAVGQWIVTAGRINAGPSGTKTNLPTNS